MPVAYAEATPSDDLITGNPRFIHRGQPLNRRVMNSADFILEMDDENQ
ncbi:MAG: hypothetical protein ACRC8Y_12060 [Chroococcales cyanobacterium]